jgi:ATP-binding protein involved in chromosome partitioning
VLGIIENMSGEIFGHGGGMKTAQDYEVPYLGSIPLEPHVRSGGDDGLPVVLAQPDSEVAATFRHIAGELAREVAIASQSKAVLPTLEV